MYFILHSINCNCIADLENINSDIIQQRVNTDSSVKQPDMEAHLSQASSLHSQPGITLVFKNAALNRETLFTFEK